MNALRLVRREYQWILAPVIAESPADDAAAADDDESSDDKVIVELSQMERAYASVHALIQLAAKDPDSAAAVASGPTPSPASLVTLLMKAGLVETALRIVRVSRALDIEIERQAVTFCRWKRQTTIDRSTRDKGLSGRVM